MKWLLEIHKKMAVVPAKYLILDEKIKPGERIVGRLTEELLRLYGVGLQMADEIQRLGEEHERNHFLGKDSDTSCEKFYIDVLWAMQQYEVLIKLFWAEVRSEFDIQSRRMGVRAHGDIVTWENDSIEKKVDEAAIAESISKAMEKSSNSSLH